MGDLAKAIVKDGLIALGVWVVARVVMVYLWGYTGYILSLGLGVILVVSFIGANLKRIVDYFGRGGGGGGPPPPPPPEGQPPGTGSAASQLCPACGGQGKTTCYRCNGRGQNLGPGGEWQTCDVCLGRAHMVCNQCFGSGRAG